MPNILITGANRGIGLALVQGYLQRDAHVFAAVRHPQRATALQTLASAQPDRLTLLTLDVNDLPSIQAAADALRQQTDVIDILINNAAINPPDEDQTLEYIDFKTMVDVFRTNSAGPLMIVQQFLSFLRRSAAARVANISSEEGSISEKRSGGSYAYRTSKTALNMISRLLAHDLARYGIIVVPLDPGWVRTDMGGRYASLAPETSARGVMRVIDGLTQADSGRYLAYDGSEHAW